jgi:hypothetical protein
LVVPCTDAVNCVDWFTLRVTPAGPTEMLTSDCGVVVTGCAKVTVALPIELLFARLVAEIVTVTSLPLKVGGAV